MISPENVFELNNEFRGSVLKSVFSTSKTDLYFVFNNKKGFKVQIFQGQAFFQLENYRLFLKHLHPPYPDLNPT